MNHHKEERGRIRKWSRVQHDMLALYRVRLLLIRECTTLMSQMRGLLAEYAVGLAARAAHVRRTVVDLPADRDERVSELRREALCLSANRHDGQKGYPRRGSRRKPAIIFFFQQLSSCWRM